MRRKLRLAVLVLALGLAAPVAVVAPAHAAAEPAGTDFRIPKSLLDWLKKNAPTLYIVFDEIMDDLFGCNCPPPPPQEPPPSQP